MIYVYIYRYNIIRYGCMHGNGCVFIEWYVNYI
jgi:hypothetical protein